MKKNSKQNLQALYYSVMISCCGIAALTIAPRAKAEVTTAKAPATYYFCSEKELVRAITRKGALDLLNIDGQLVVYTDVNTSGRKPHRDARLVAMRYAADPYETQVLVVNRGTYTQHLNLPKSIVIDVTPAQQEGLLQQPVAPEGIKWLDNAAASFPKNSRG